MALLLALRGQHAPSDVAFVPRADQPISGAVRSPSSAAATSTRPSPPPSPSAKPSPKASPRPSRTRAPAPPPVAAPPATRPTLTVLNNSRVRGLAARGAALFRAAGWPVGTVGNLPGRTPVTTVYYAPGQRAAAQALAAAFPAIRSVQPRAAGLPGRGLIVVLTRDFG